MSRPSWMSRANALTILRAVCAPLLILAILRDAPGLAAGLFALAVVTDLADGRVARHYGEATPLGALLDHATDALFVSAGLGALAHRGIVPGLLPWLVAAAFIQYVLDSRPERGKALRARTLRASRLGRWNGIAYFVLLGIPLVQDALALAWPPGSAVRAFGWLLVASTLASMTGRALAWQRGRRQP